MDVIEHCDCDCDGGGVGGSESEEDLLISDVDVVVVVGYDMIVDGDTAELAVEVGLVVMVVVLVIWCCAKISRICVVLGRICGSRSNNWVKSCWVGLERA